MPRVIKGATLLAKAPWFESARYCLQDINPFSVTMSLISK